MTIQKERDMRPTKASEVWSAWQRTTKEFKGLLAALVRLVIPEAPPKHSRPKWWPQNEREFKRLVWGVIKLIELKSTTSPHEIRKVPDNLKWLPPEMLELNNRRLGEYLMEVLIPYANREYRVAHPRHNHPLNCQSRGTAISKSDGPHRTYFYPRKMGLKEWGEWLEEGS
ncbi:hypothetical protein KJ903_01945 [Patescibacteria group bacterium]|nr:hypothetical protein [Patescibacteria group bacterium]